MKTRIFKIAAVSLLVTAAWLTSAAAYQSKETGANINPPAAVTEGQYGKGRLGSMNQPQPEVFNTGPVYGITEDWPMYTPELAVGEGRDQVKAFCSICHNTTYISMQPPLSAQAWKKTVYKMLNTFGARDYIPAEQVPIIVKYLQSHYTPETISDNNYSEAIPPGPTVSSSESTSIAAGSKSQKTTTATTMVVAKVDAAGAEVYQQNCVACHQTNGEGIAGAFPPQKGHAPAIYRASGGIGGRRYLVRVLLYGLSGNITVDGKSYNGVMPPWSASLSNQQIADVLNYILTAWGNDTLLPVDFKPYTAKDIGAEDGKKLTGEDVARLRRQLK